MKLLSRFHWWQRLRGGYWLKISADPVRYERYACMCAFIEAQQDVDFAKPDFTLEERLIQIVGTADPDEIRKMLDEAKDSWRPPGSAPNWHALAAEVDARRRRGERL